MNAFLSGTSASGKTAKWKLKHDTLIGRDAPADLVLPLASISRQHARIEYREPGYFIRDLDSRNGTFVNGAPIHDAPRRLQNGDVIVLAGAVTLRFIDPEETLDGLRIGRLKGLWIDDASRAVWVNAQKIEPPLSAAQTALLALLYRAPGKIFSRDEIIAAVWPGVDAGGISEEAIDALIKRLRARLRESGAQQEYIQVLRG
ncbi:MAG: FHA domain-containing protein, partial [Chloroflexi bacterium]|nr:FHA domain-containing protein [Chloroflexota bacterium]